MSSNSQEGERTRATLFVDGFNLYHPLRELGKPHLKWLDLWSLGELICRDRGHQLTGVVYCTAFQKDSPEQRERHQRYIDALEARGVKTLLGHYLMAESKPCHHCGSTSQNPTEKQTDINLALSVFDGALQDEFDWAYLLSADSDQTATAKFLRNRFPEKSLLTISPPNKPISTNVANYAAGKRRLNEQDIEKCRLPEYVQLRGGSIVRCPREYSVLD